jgi:hypothetical protein
MTVVSSSGRRAGRAVAAALVAAALGLGLPVACVTAPPPDLPVQAQEDPIIVGEMAIPSTDGYLTELPEDGTFLVPVRANQPFFSSATYNYNPGPTNGLSGTFGALGTHPWKLSMEDGGLIEVSFDLSSANPPLDPTLCAVIQLEVSSSSFDKSFRTPGGSVTSIEWHYTPGGPGSCDTFDAGDGAFPDAPIDGLPLTPDAANLL